jgi:hypothetical protein
MKNVVWYGKDAAGKIEYAEAFEICEYGRQPTKDELRELFPIFGTTLDPRARVAPMVRTCVRT